ncbi:MAG: hypothetical protein RLZ75_328 [Pseudomonadota bacterium]
MNFSKVKMNLLLATALFSSINVVNAEGVVPGGSVLKNIEQNNLPNPVKELAAEKAASLENKKLYLDIKHLLAVDVKGAFFTDEIVEYWKPMYGQEITVSRIEKFKEWAWSEFTKEGYFALLTFDVQKYAEGQVLTVNVSLPKVKNVKVIAKSRTISKYYTDLVAEKLSKVIKSGAAVDTLDLEQQLNNLSYSLPLELDITVRPSGNEFVDLIVNVDEKVGNLGHIKNAYLQFNTFGLNQYGREQGVGSITVEGFTKGSNANLLGQVSGGLAYGKFDYESPAEFLAGHYHVWGSLAYSKSITGGLSAIEGLTSHYGGGISHILGSKRNMIFKSYVDFSQRNTETELLLGGIKLDRITDNQTRVKFSADNLKLARSLQSYDLTIINGTDNYFGFYNKFEANIYHQRSLNDKGLSLQAKINAQFAPSRNLDVYNKIALGGINGVRAYTTNDGLGDQGAVGSIELKQQVFNTHAISAFLDAGVVEPNKSAVRGSYNQTYGLYDGGIALSGLIYKNFTYMGYVAKGFGGYAGYSSYNQESSPDNWRLNCSVSYVY